MTHDLRYQINRLIPDLKRELFKYIHKYKFKYITIELLSNTRYIRDTLDRRPPRSTGQFTTRMYIGVCQCYKESSRYWYFLHYSENKRNYIYLKQNENRELERLKYAS